jgi:Tfp pilus assembly ATPase PilU
MTRMDTQESPKRELEVTDMLAKRMVEKKASDLFITAGVAPCIKVNGRCIRSTKRRSRRHGRASWC